MKKLVTLLAGTAVSLAMAGTAMAEKWDMPMAYSATNFHSAVGAEFAKCVTTGTGGDIEIVTHPSGSLFKGGLRILEGVDRRVFSLPGSLPGAVQETELLLYCLGHRFPVSYQPERFASDWMWAR